MDLSFEGPPFNALQAVALCQALQCFADCLSCLSFQKKPLCTHMCAQALSVSVCLWKERKPGVPQYLLQGGCPVSIVLPPILLPLEKIKGTQMYPVTADALTSPLNQQGPPCSQGSGGT